MVSGKGTVAAYVCEKYGSKSYKFSTILRNILDRIYVDQSRENIQKISSALRENFGQDVLAKSIALDVEKDDNEVVVVDGIRRFPDIEHLKKMHHFKMVYIDAAIEIKYERLIKRGENTDDNSKSLEGFKRDHEAEAEIQIRGLRDISDYVVDNNGTLENLHAQIDKIISESI
jgi:dephospho-CoA kinase